jgi:hypothetical protein
VAEIHVALTPGPLVRRRSHHNLRQRSTITPLIQRIAFLAAAARLRSPSDSRFCPGSVATVRLLMLPAFGVAVAARGGSVPAPLGVWAPVDVLATLLARLAATLASAARRSVACRASVAVTVPAGSPVRSIRTAPSVLALR